MCFSTSLGVSSFPFGVCRKKLLAISSLLRGFRFAAQRGQLFAHDEQLIPARDQLSAWRFQLRRLREQFFAVHEQLFPEAWLHMP